MQVDLQKRENTQTTILALLITRKGGCTVKQLSHDYYELEGEHIPWKDLGYNSLLSFLHSMSKTVQIEHRDNTIIIHGIASEKSKHVSRLIAGQKAQKPSVGRKTHRPNHYFPTTAPNRIRIPAEILSKVISLVKDKPNGLNKDYILQEIHSRMPFVKITMKEMEEQLQELSHRIFQTNNKIYPNRSKVKKFNNLKDRNDMSHSKSKLPIITAAGNEDSDDMLDCEDVLEVTQLNHTSISDYTKLDTKSKSTFSCMKETNCQDQETQHSDNIKTKFEDDIMKDKENVLDQKDIEILINERIKFRLEKLIQNHSDGIWCADLPEKYLEEYKVPLNYAELGFNSVREFASQLPEIFHCIQPRDTGDFMLYYAKREIPSNKLTKKHEANNIAQWYNIYEPSNEEAVPASVSLDTCKKLIPDNVMSIGDYVGCINVADLEQNEEPFIEVIVVEVFTPSFFWIQLRKKQKIFKMFMDDLHKFYTMQYEQYAIPLLVLEKGLNCACVYNGIWHRGIIKAVKPDFQVTVMFYDYGTLKTYSPNAVYYLHKKFSILPAQAIPCGLINTRPCTGSKWSRSATHHFALRTSDIPLVATIATINKEDNSMMVNLTDTLEDEDVHINDWLVEQKLAEYGKMVCIKKRNFPICHYLERQECFKRQKPSDIYRLKEKLSKNSGNKIVHNLNSDIGLPHSSNFNEVNSNKEDSYNKLISHRGKSKRSEYFQSTNSSKNDFLIEKMHGSVTNSEKKHPRKTESLYKMLLHLKLKSINSTKINNDNNDNSNNQICEIIANKKCLGSSSVLNQPIEQKSYEKSVMSCHNNVEHNNTISDTSSTDLSTNNRKNSKTLDNKCNILKERTNIPKQYGSVTNPEKKHPRKTESLYKMLLHLKLKSIDSTKINNDNNDNSNNQICETIANKKCLGSSSVLNQLIEQKSYEKSVISCHNDMEHNTTSDTLSIDLSVNNKKNSKTLDNKCNILKERTNIPKQYGSVTNPGKKHPRKTESLYKMLLHLKLKSIDSTKINNDNNDNSNNQICETIANKKCLGSSSVLNQLIEQKSYEKSVISCHNDMEHNTTSDTLSIDLSVNNKKNSKTLDNKCNILKERTNIPKQYANHFDIRESEDEIYISDVKNFTDPHEVYITENIDWSIILKNALQEKNNITQESESKIPRETSIRKQSNVPLAENCFLKVVYNSSYSALHDKDIRWSSTGNIAKMSNVSPLILENIERRKKRIKDNVIIAISQKILGMLTDEKLYDASRNVKDTQPMNSSQKTNNTSVENDTSLIALENYEQNDYICMKTITSKQKLLEKLSSIKDISNDNSSLDSDDLSTVTESTSFHCNINGNNNNNKCKKYENDTSIHECTSNGSWSEIDIECKKYESNTNIHESTSNESWPEIDVECSVKTEAINSNTQEVFRPMINNSEVYEKEEISKSANNLEDLTLVSTSSQQSTTTEKSDLIENINCSEESSLNVEVKESVRSMEKSLLNEETRQTEVVSVEELIQYNTVIGKSDIPVFNDVDIVSNERVEQLDAYISYAELSNLLNTTFNESTQIKFSDNEFDSHLSTVEITDSNSIEDAKCIETYKNTESNTYEVMYSDRISNQEDKMEDLTNKSVKFESHIPVIHSENNSERSNKYMSNLNYKSQGKARTLVEMLNNKCKKYENDTNIHGCTSNGSWSEIDIECKKYESNTNIHESTSNESWPETDVESSVKTKAINSNSQEFFKPTINNSEVYEKEEISKSANNLEDLTLVSTSSQQSTTTEKSGLIKNINCSEESSLNVEVKESVRSMEKSLLNEETRQTEVVSVEELIKSTTVIEKSDIPVFNDVDIESDKEEEQWDVNISYAELSNFLKGTFNGSTQNKFSDNEFDSRLNTVEINDLNSIENGDCIGTYTNIEGDTYEVMHSDRISNQEDKMEDLTNKSIKVESHIPVIHSENNSERSNKFMSNLNYESQGKGRKLIEMLNKAKLLQRDRSYK
ncbi:uncharacterized protein MAL13P1.304-like [Bombus pascuorum]|uniref:uncharacterized protein MAL13P1.304-like n=1 Tax=Bombus pascuorum TaxID=65598 RepID=UPI00298DB5CB|nr:uncharacterized protein MAL13P1.304-like [Bombus pascuorum]XP_060812234.1 uncharacterized protein MAL13P1.304-like [Bombus pascuorum]